jgi:hypothetical protein
MKISHYIKNNYRGINQHRVRLLRASTRVRISLKMAISLEMLAFLNLNTMNLSNSTLMKMLTLIENSLDPW